MKQSLVQILVVVANTKDSSLRAEVEKGSTRTAIDRGLIGPKLSINFRKGAIGRLLSFIKVVPCSERETG